MFLICFVVPWFLRIRFSLQIGKKSQFVGRLIPGNLILYKNVLRKPNHGLKQKPVFILGQVASITIDIFKKKEVRIKNAKNMLLASTLTLTLGLGLCKANEAPKYLWKPCEKGQEANLYDKNFEVESVYENDTIRMSDYKGQVRSNFHDSLMKVSFY